MNSEPELLTRIDDDIQCHACGTKFDRAGKIVHEPPEPVPKKS
jgi:hypothetical protein